MTTRSSQVIIIGAGISGLYAAYKLAKSTESPSVLILEQKPRIGGRIKTITVTTDDKEEEPIRYDAGAVRISSHHKRTLELIDTLNLDESLQAHDLPTRYYIQSKSSTTTKELDSIMKQADNLPAHKLRPISFASLASTFANSEDAERAREQLGYDVLGLNMNGQTLLANYNNYKGSYAVLRDGLSSICHKLSSIIGEKQIHTSQRVNRILWNSQSKTFTIHTLQGRRYSCPEVIVALPPRALLQIPLLESYYPLFRSVSMNNYMRVYAIYPKHPTTGKVWFHKYGKVVTDLPIRQVIPMNPETGLIQIAYCDGEKAKVLNQQNSLGNLYSFIEPFLQQLFPKATIPKPDYYRGHYWAEGTHYWKPHVNSTQIQKQIRRPNQAMPLYICGEAFSRHQAWIEGALESAESIVDYRRQLQHKSIYLEPSYTLAEVAKHNTRKDAWVIYHDVVYDITKWIPRHPGLDTILAGLGTDITYLFDTVGHSVQAENILLQYRIGILSSRNRSSSPSRNKKAKANNKTTTKATTNSKKYTIAEVAKHNKKSDAWIIYRNKVYDITKWIPKHPGGNIILSGLGKDITTMFTNVGHSSNAISIMKSFMIGSLDS